MNFSKTVISFLAMLLVVVPPLDASNLDPGVVDLQKVREKSPEFQRKFQNFKARKQRALNQLDRMEKNLNVEIRKLRKTATENPSGVARRKKLVLYRKLQTLKRRRNRLEDRLKERKTQLENQFLQTLREKVHSVATQKNLNVIYNKSRENSFHKILWTAPKRDLTDAILRELNS